MQIEGLTMKITSLEALPEDTRVVASPSDDLIAMLRKARDFLAADPDNWVQRNHQHYNGVCMVQAILTHGADNPIPISALRQNPIVIRALRELSHSLRNIRRNSTIDSDSSPIGEVVWELTSYNDLVTTKRDDVIAVYNSALGRLQNAS